MNIALFQPCGEGTENIVAERCSILLLVMTCEKWSLPRLVSARLHRFYVMLSDMILMLCPV